MDFELTYKSLSVDQQRYFWRLASVKVHTSENKIYSNWITLLSKFVSLIIENLDYNLYQIVIS